MYKQTIFYICLFCSLLCSSIGYSKPPIFISAPEDAFALSEDLDIDVLLIFTASWCQACVTMKNDLHNNLSVLDDTIVCYVDHDAKIEMVREYKVKTLPSYFLYRKKIEKRRGFGYQNLSKFKKWLENDDK